jgi:hypothetical protein
MAVVDMFVRVTFCAAEVDSGDSWGKVRDAGDSVKGC